MNTKAGGAKVAATTKRKYGEDYYKLIGSKGGKASNNGGFASEKVGTDGLTGKERASKVGIAGGRVSRRLKGAK